MKTGNNNPLVSVVILSYNNELYIKDSIESVLNQTYKNLQIIITDDCSNDKSFEIISSFKGDERVVINRNSINLGITKNFNVGLDLCKGDYIVFTGGDDLFQEKKIEKQVKLMKSNSNLKMCYHNAFLIDENGKYLGKNFNHKYSPFRKGDILTSLYCGTFNCGCTTMIINSNLKFNENIKSTSDWLFYLDLLSEGGEIDFIDENLSSYRRHSNSYTYNSGYFRSLEHILTTLFLFSVRHPKYFFHALISMIYQTSLMTFNFFRIFLKAIIKQTNSSKHF